MGGNGAVSEAFHRRVETRRVGVIVAPGMVPDEPAKRATLREVAAAAGVSVATASYALRGHARITAETRARVAAAAERLGYRRDVHASALAMRGRSRGAGGPSFALIELASDRPRRRGATERFSGFSQALTASGYGATRHGVRDGGQLTRLLRQLHHQGYEGVALSEMKPEWVERVPPALLAEFCLVEVGRYAAAVRLNRCRSDHFWSAKFLTEKLMERGFRRVGFAPMSHFPRLPDDEARLGGYLAARFCHADMQGVEIPPFLGDFQDQEGFEAWMRKHRPDSVVGFHVGVAFWVAELAPEAGFAALHINAKKHPEIAGMAERTERLGAEAAGLLDQSFRLGERGLAEHPREVVLPAEFRDGPTMDRAAALLERRVTRPSPP